MNLSALLQQIRLEFKKQLVGQEQLLEGLLIALLCEGHALLEGVPGLAKTLSVKTFSQLAGLSFKRIQFTPDLLPADLLGTQIYTQATGSFSVKKGPLFSQLVLADEINRAPAKVQSALLQAMEERIITIGEETFPLDRPYLVLATQNPIEQEGTYPLPEAQVDRFLLKVLVTYPAYEEEKIIIQRNLEKKPIAITPLLSTEKIAALTAAAKAIYLDDRLYHYLLDLVHATRTPEKFKLDPQLIELGASPRASIALAKAAKAKALLGGKTYVTAHDIKQVAPAVLRHRLKLSYEAQAEGVSEDAFIESLLNSVRAP